MASNIYITPKTSLVLIKSLAQETNIYMSTYNVPDFQINIRDATGSQTLVTNPIHICTINGARFMNNTTHYEINQPFGFVNISLRTSTLWQVLHTSGQTPESSAANVTITNFSTVFTELASTASKYVSSLIVENIDTPNSIQITGPFIIGNLSTPGFVQFQSTFNVYGDVTFDSSAFVSGATIFKSSLFANQLIPLSSIFRGYGNVETSGSISVAGTVNVSTLQTNSSLLVRTLDVQLSSINTPVVFTENFQVPGLLSSLGNLHVQSNTSILKNFTVSQTLSTLADTFSLQSSLTILGRLIALSSLSTTNQLAVTRFESSLTLQSSLGVQTNLSTLSSAFVTNTVSSGLFQTNLLSSATSFSTAGEFSVLSTLTVKGNLSTNLLRIFDTLSIGTDLIVLKDLSTIEGTELKDVVVAGSALFNSIFAVTGRLGTKGRIETEAPIIAGKTELEDVKIQNLLYANEFAYFSNNLGVGSDLRVDGDITAFGTTFVNQINSRSYSVSSLFITTSSPSVALRVSSLEAPSVTSESAKFVSNPLSGSVALSVNKSIRADIMYANSAEISKLSTLQITTNNLLPSSQFFLDYGLSDVDIQFLPDTYPTLSKSGFLEGLSTTFIQASNIVAKEFRGSFIGNGNQLSNVPLLKSTLNATTVYASSINTSLFSSARLNLGENVWGFFSNEVKVSTNLFVNRYSVFKSAATLPAVFISSGGLNLEDEFLGTSNLMFGKMETLNSSTLVVNDTLFLNARSRRIGVMISSPQYDFDINGSLYFSGQLLFSTFVPKVFLTAQPTVAHSTLFYSSIFIRDSLVLPPAFDNFVQGSTPAITLVPNSFTSNTKPVLIAARQFPYNSFIANLEFFQGIFTNSNFSTLDFSSEVFINNFNKNVGIGTLRFPPLSFFGTPSNFDNFDLLSVYPITAREVRISTVSIFTKLTLSSFVTPTLGIFPPSISTLNTFVAQNLSTLVLDQFVELSKDTSLKGSFQIKRPVDAPLQALFSVYNDAYISSISVKNLIADTISCGFQDL